MSHSHDSSSSSHLIWALAGLSALPVRWCAASAVAPSVDAQAVLGDPGNECASAALVTVAAEAILDDAGCAILAVVPSLRFTAEPGSRIFVSFSACNVQARTCKPMLTDVQGHEGDNK